MTLQADAVALAISAISFLVALGSAAYTMRNERRAWSDWEAWSATERQRITKIGEEVMSGKMKATAAAIEVQLAEAKSWNMKAQAQVGRAMRAAAREEQVQAQEDRDFLPLPSQLGIDPEEVAVRQRQAAQGIERDEHGWARNGGGN